MIERTLSIVKPDAVRQNRIGEILARLEGAGLKLVAGKFIRLNRDQAARFYAEHSEKKFFGSLMDFMTSGPVFVSVLEGEGAILKNRQVMGSTDPGKADAGTIRKDFGSNIEQNAAHGSDSPESARREVSFYFNELEIQG